MNSPFVVEMGNQYTHKWTDKELETAIKLWSEDFTAKYIGEVIGKSSNAVLGMMRRHGMSHRKGKRLQEAPPVIPPTAPITVSPLFAGIVIPKRKPKQEDDDDGDD